MTWALARLLGAVSGAAMLGAAAYDGRGSSAAVGAVFGALAGFLFVGACRADGLREERQ